MENYKILGIDENASMEEVRKAYENKVNEIKKEIVDERRAKAFIKVFDKAYEEIKSEKEKIQNQETMLINIREKELNQYEQKNISRNNIDEYNDFEEYETDERVNNTKKKSTTKNISKNNKNNKKKQLKNINLDSREEKNLRNDIKKQAKQEEKSLLALSLIKIPFKILAVPIVAILSIVIFLCKVINLISWIASKLLIIAAISISAIHGYQIYLGQAIQYNIFIISAIVFIISLFLPSILKVVPSALTSVNNKLKEFAFNY